MPAYRNRDDRCLSPSYISIRSSDTFTAVLISPILIDGQAPLIKTRKRIDELDRIIQKLYEDNVSGRITDERYDKMAQNYETEQSTLTKKLAELEEAEASYGSERNSIDDFIANANRFIDIQELTPEIVHAFISKIYVYEKKEKWSRTEGNDIDIVFTVGFREQHTVRTSDAIAS